VKQRKLWLAALVGIAAVVTMNIAADAQPTPISACGMIISIPGSYTLNRNLNATSTVTNCIDVSVSWVTINLNGFVLTGKGGTATGIFSNFAALTVSNGAVNGFGVGVTGAGSGTVLRKVSVGSNIKSGAVLGSYARVSDSQFQGNGTGGSGDGLDVGQNSVITHSIFNANKGDGLKATGGGVVVVGSTASNNTVDGFLTAGSSVLKNNTATGNTRLGFCDDCSGGKGSTFRSNVATSNGNIGIEFFGSTAIGNNASNNGDFGIADDGLSTVANNTSSNNVFDGFVSADLSTFTGNTGSANSRYGFNIVCPVNLIGNTGIDKSGNHIGAGCNLLDNLGF
jgi:hypothetical protein